MPRIARRRIFNGVLGLAALLLAPLADPSAALARSAGCRGTLSVSTQIFFGTRKPDGSEVSREDWEGFVTEVLVPAFADGFTVLAARGYWRDRPLQPTQTESSMVVLRVHKGRPGDQAAIEGVIAAYKQRFQQKSVLQQNHQVCAIF